MYDGFMYEEFTQDRLAQLRIQKGVSARDMSLSLGQNSNYINQIENKKALPSLQGLFYICEYFDITPQQFFDVDNGCPVHLSELIKKLKNLDAGTLELISALIDKLPIKNNHDKLKTGNPNGIPFRYCLFFMAVCEN